MLTMNSSTAVIVQDANALAMPGKTVLPRATAARVTSGGNALEAPALKMRTSMDATVAGASAQVSKSGSTGILF